jgi:hypothetical protein
MTFQPPPPPPPGGNPPSPGGYPAPQSGFDPKTVNPLDWGIIAAGVLAFIFSLFDYYTVDVSVKGVAGASASASASAWHGFFGWFAALLAVVGAALIAIELFAPQVKLPIPTRLAGLGAFALATLCVILALFVFPGDDPPSGLGYSVDEGHGIGYWVSLIVIVAGTVLSLMRLQATGGKLPGALGNMPNIGGYGPQGGSGGPQPGPGVTPPPPPGYGPPQ